MMRAIALVALLVELESNQFSFKDVIEKGAGVAEAMRELTGCVGGTSAMGATGGATADGARPPMHSLTSKTTDAANVNPRIREGVVGLIEILVPEYPRQITTTS